MTLSRYRAAASPLSAFPIQGVRAPALAGCTRSAEGRVGGGPCGASALALPRCPDDRGRGLHSARTERASGGGARRRPARGRLGPRGCGRCNDAIDRVPARHLRRRGGGGDSLSAQDPSNSFSRHRTRARAGRRFGAGVRRRCGASAGPTHFCHGGRDLKTPSTTTTTTPGPLCVRKMNTLYVTVSIPLLLLVLLAGLNHAHGLTTFGKTQSNQNAQQPNVKPVACSTQTQCYIPNTTCLRGHCLCGDNSYPVNGHCSPNLRKGARHLCTKDSDCVDNANCELKEKPKGPGQQPIMTNSTTICVCQEGFNEVSEGECDGALNLRIWPGLVFVLAIISIQMN